VRLLHEVHRVAGAKEDAFDEAYRDELMPALATSDGSSLLGEPPPAQRGLVAVVLTHL
jgi:hypothetical protein